MSAYKEFAEQMVDRREYTGVMKTQKAEEETPLSCVGPAAREAVHAETGLVH
jgi:hypothetical protein